MIPQAGKKPTRKAPLRGKKFKQSQQDISLQDHEPQVVDKRQVCVDVLLEGYVHAYVDLFYLTHRNDPQSNTSIQISESEMNKLRENLTQAEQARRTGDTQTVFKSYTRLAAYYNDIQDVKTAIFFYEKCLEIARLTMDPQAELTALHNIGTAHFNCGAYQEASEYHEEQLQKAKTTLNDEFETKANLQLTQVYKKMAEEQEQIDVAVEYYQKSLEMADAADEPALFGLAQYQLGKAIIVQNKPHEAIPYLEKYLEICNELNDAEGKGAALAALAMAHQKIGAVAEAVKDLQLYLEVAVKTENLAGQAEACCNLGVIYNNRKDFTNAVKMFEKNYHLARSIVAASGKNRVRLDTARVYLGMARGNENMNEYAAAINHDVQNLVEWKLKRTALKI